MKLNPEQIEFIKQELTKAKIYYTDIQDELIDHVASETENLMQEGLDFNTAFQLSALAVNPEKFQMDVLIANLMKAKSIFISMIEPIILIKSLLLVAAILATVQWLGVEPSFASKLIKISFVTFLVLMALIGLRMKLLKNSKVAITGSSVWIIFCLSLPITNFRLFTALGFDPKTIWVLITVWLSFLFVSGISQILREVQKLKTT